MDVARRMVLLKGDELNTQIISKAYVYVEPEDGDTAEGVEVRALWDTGATHCQVTPELAERMHLKSLGQREINGPGGKYISNIYELGLLLNESIWFRHVYFGESCGAGRFDIVIGMNAIQAGELRLEGKGADRTFVFEIK